MNRTLIVSRDTAASLLEAHAALAAWYHRHAQALGTSGLVIEPPTESERRAYLEQLATHFPELAEVARAIPNPRPYVPPPAIVHAPTVAAASVEAGSLASSATATTDVRAPMPVGAPEPDESVAAEHATTHEPLESEGEAPGAVSSPPPSMSSPPASVPPAAVPPPPLVDPAKVKY